MEEEGKEKKPFPEPDLIIIHHKGNKPNTIGRVIKEKDLKLNNDENNEL